MNTNYSRNESWIDNTFSRRGKCVIALLAAVFTVGIIAGGCGFLQNIGSGSEEQAPASVEQPTANAAPEAKESVNVPTEDSTDVDVKQNESNAMVSYDVTDIGRSDPFMPSSEVEAVDSAINSALAEANAYNSRISELTKLKGVTIREQDDISPYKFNLPVPPTSLASSESAAAKITRTKVVGIMYNKTSPSAIINVDNKDYLVRTGDKIIGQEYKVVQINPNWITVSLGSNVYSASIGELFERDNFDKSQNDLYNLKNRFGGRKG